ncbi:MAG TPA: GNAT family N-acetyltransferase [Candidatus Limnocylindrales bacterium]|nr:GNAT family N-acetyltransferase [Candidatus Limnocylindrales bacterium]
MTASGGAGSGDGIAAGDVRYRQGTSEDLDACTRIWKAGIEDYQSRLNQPTMPDDLAPLRRLLAHLMDTDPDRFWVAVRTGGGIVGFSAASVREGLWFLAMLFVHPDAQASGLGQALMDHAQAGRGVDPGGPAVPGPDTPYDSGIHTWGMCTDAVQPISNGLYARRGMVPRIPIWRLFGEVRRWSAVPQLPGTLEALAFETVAGTEPDGERRLQAILDDLDREVIGSAHPADHAFLRREGRVGFLVRDRADARPLGYVYGSGIGRMGPLLALDPALHPALIGVAVRETPALGPVALWVPGTAAVATRALLDAGLRFDGFPGLICWSRADHPFERYLPISLAVV